MNEISPEEIVHSGLCVGCGSCAARIHAGSTKMIMDEVGFLKPDETSPWFKQKTHTFARTCPFSPLSPDENFIGKELFEQESHDASIGYFRSAYVGYAAEGDFRKNGSSGGMVSWVAAELLRMGLVDAIVHAGPVNPDEEDGKFFKYKVSRTVEEITSNSKSRYYPVEMSEVLREIYEVSGRYAVVGIPCFIKAVQLLRLEDPVYRDRIRFTLGLFCGHMKSAAFVESFAWQLNVPMRNVKKVEYRFKDPSRPASWYNARLTTNTGEVVSKDWWHLVDGDWGAGYFMNSACNYCDDVVSETADISFGDAWVEPYTSDGNGTNVVVVRSKELEAIVLRGISEAKLHLDKVDAEFIHKTQEAGFRQRREGLAYRLTWKKKGIPVIKREFPVAYPELHRRWVYKVRYMISSWSLQIFRIAKATKLPAIYVRWAGWMIQLYRGLTYETGRWGKIFKLLK